MLSKRTWTALALVALAALPAHAGGKGRWLTRPTYSACANGTCSTPPPVYATPAFPVVTQAPAPARVYPSPSSPPPALVPVRYLAPVVPYATWPRR